ncbi:MAG: VOC family protein [Vicinamibacteria bacterium]
MRTVRPMIHVPDVAATARWYESIGFTIERTFSDGEEMTWASISFGDGSFMLSAGGRPSDADRRDVDLYVTVDDVDALYARLRDRVEVVETPYDAFHGMRELIIRDPNRFWVTFGRPIAG